MEPKTEKQYFKADKSGKRIHEGDWCRACYRDSIFHYVQGRVFVDDDGEWKLRAEGSVLTGQVFNAEDLYDWDLIDCGAI